MNLFIKTCASFIILALGLWVIGLFRMSGAESLVASALAVEDLNGGTPEFMAKNMFQRTELLYAVKIAWVIMWVICTTVWLMFGTRAKPKYATMRPKHGCCNTLLALLALFPFLPSCMKPYQTPVYQEVGSNETAYVLPLEGDANVQAKLNSKEFYEKHKVRVDRIEIPTRWNQTGRQSDSGEWIPTVRVIVVPRTPETRNWQAGDGGTSTKDEAIWVESADSVGFSMGFNCTAFIKEEDTSTFLYWYSAEPVKSSECGIQVTKYVGSLSRVMDTEVRARIQKVVAQESAKYPLDDLRSRKNEIAAQVEKEVLPFFAERGITISAVSMYGGMTYENAAIQSAIDNVFVAQQEKNVALAKFDAQKKENERIVLAAEGVAKQRTTEADAEAKAITVLTNAVAQGGTNYLALKALEVQLKQTDKWDGKLPTFSGGTTTPIISADKFLGQR